MRALQLVRNFERVLIYNRTSELVEEYIEEMTAVLNTEIIQADSIADVVRQSEVVVTTTPAKEPFLRAEWLHPGLHITAMGSDAEEKNELHPDVLARADLLVCDRKSQVFRLGEHHHALAASVIAEDDESVEVGELTAERHPGRANDKQITVCDLTGTGVQDTAIALLAYRKAQEKGFGMTIEA
jgi:ornithine cyclodeaminase